MCVCYVRRELGAAGTGCFGFSVQHSWELHSSNPAWRESPLWVPAMLAVNDLWPEQRPQPRPQGRTKSFSLCSVKTPPQPSQQMPSTHIFCGVSGMWGCHPELGVPIVMFVRVYLDHNPRANTSYGAAPCTSGSQEGHLHRTRGVRTCVCVAGGMCICAHRHVHTRACVCICAHKCVHTGTYVCICAHGCVYLCSQACTHRCICVCIIDMFEGFGTGRPCSIEAQIYSPDVSVPNWLTYCRNSKETPPR